jgi:hypothetical protein
MIKINPAKAILIPVGMDDQIVSGIQFVVDPNGNNLTVTPGRVRINSLYMDMAIAIETNLSAAPTGVSLMALTQSLNLTFIDDNNFSDKLVIGVIDKKPSLTLITPVVYTESSIGTQVPPSSIVDVFDPSISADIQIRMLFDELAINKTKDADLKYEEMLEALPVEYNAVFKETFANTVNFVDNTLTYNAYTRTMSLGIIPPYPTDMRVLTEKVVLSNSISKAYISVDKINNDQTCNIRLSFDNGATWVPYVEEGEYMAGAGADFMIEISMRTANRNVTPLLRSWAVFYQQL